MTARIVIVGGGQAGGWAAKTLRDEGFDGEICVVAEEEWDFYERPPLSKAALLDTDAQLPRLFSHETQQALNLTWYRPLRAEQIDRVAKTVILSNGEQISYNILLVATGGRARLPGEAWAAHPQVYTLRHWQDAQRLKSRLAESQKLAIVGGGWIGLEIAASARKKRRGGYAVRAAACAVHAFGERRGVATLSGNSSRAGCGYPYRLRRAGAGR
ncbi:pyridine nucleotide-disulfide oxidoreductase [Klebsiella michiganensis]|nr:pyridine nucleotide-disulfide oxidoreductase [Klebsiella michiganensis]